MSKFVDQEIARIRKLVGDEDHVLGAVSGGVDSTVAAKLMDRAIGSRFHAVLVDVSDCPFPGVLYCPRFLLLTGNILQNGVLRLNEAEQVKKTLSQHLGINLTVVDASQQFLDGLRGVSDPEQKRKFIGGKFIDVFEEEAKKIEAAAAHKEGSGRIRWFLQGTLYPDVIECASPIYNCRRRKHSSCGMVLLTDYRSISYKGPSVTIKTHHNVGGLPKRMTEGHGLKLIEVSRLFWWECLFVLVC